MLLGDALECWPSSPRTSSSAARPASAARPSGGGTPAAAPKLGRNNSRYAARLKRARRASNGADEAALEGAPAAQESSAARPAAPLLRSHSATGQPAFSGAL